MPDQTDTKGCPSDEDLVAMLDQSLSESELIVVEQHLSDCDACQSRLDNLTDASDLRGAESDLSSIPDAVVEQLRETPTGRLSDTTPRISKLPPPDRELATMGDFEITEHIASGASGALYRARDQRLDRTVAIKVMHATVAASDAARERLRREARAVAAVNHPNVVSIYSVGEDDHQRPFMAMELIDGLSIAQIIEQRGPLSVSDAASLAEQTARGLSAAHDQSLIHRDVKSSNILVDNSSNQAKVVDFGLVRDDEQATQLTMEGMLAGTPAYMSPEQITDPTAVDIRTDVYSLGIVLYEMLTGVVPFRGVIRMTLHQVQHSEPQAPRELNDVIPRDLQTICLKAIEKDPARRYQRIEEFADDLAHWRNNEPIRARPISRLEYVWRWCQRNPRIAVLSCLVAFALTTTLGVSAAAAYQLSIADEEVREADQEARRNAAALVEQRDAAMETVRRLVFDVPAQMQELPFDTSEVEKSILQIALDGLDKIGRSAESSGEVDLNTAYALQQLGNALIMAGEYESAEQQLNRALALVNKILKNSDINVSEARSLEQATYFALADVALDKGDLQAEQSFLQQAVTAGRRWVESTTTDPDVKVALATSLNLLAEFEMTDGDESVASRLYEESDSLLQKVLEEYPNHEAAIMELDATMFDEIDDVEHSPEVDRLKRSLQAALRAAQEQFDQHSDSDASRRMLVNSLLEMSRWHATFGVPDRADSLCEKAQGLCLKEGASTDLVLSQKVERYLADSALASFSTKRARNNYRTALERAQELQNSTDSATTTLEVIRCQIGIGETFIQQSNGKKARPFFDQATNLLQDESLPPDIVLKLRITTLMGQAWGAYYESDDRQAQSFHSTAEELLKSLPPSDDVFRQEWTSTTKADASDLRAALREDENSK